MRSTIKKAAIIISSIGITALSTPAYSINADLSYDTEFKSCVAELANQIDMKDAIRLQHVISKTDQTRIGYTLRFDTSVFSANEESRYSVYCVAKGENAPVKFEVKEINI